MDTFNKFTGQNKTQNANASSGQGSGGVGGLFNNAMGGGATGEKKEDPLDKGVDMFQQHVLKQGPQTNESAMEQAKDERISDAIRSGWKKATGSNFPVADK
ncbi:hypothetical protein BDN72DRAFT_842579 [Pluteus cervinus]|uniref:Uncharacterized protein n=1 Tax=Pluteus cervinus TaxID=181527 RepID=A0ACD3APE6_9AGAR|nr:hypothetical protein BDN72DRAFT_842579 [Pluteus cervinus]